MFDVRAMGAFPAHAGMNRRRVRAASGCRCVPRTRGDEPVREVIHSGDTERSPHTRG